MAIVIEREDIDLVVEPHPHSDEDYEAFRRAVEQRRKHPADQATLEQASRLLAQGVGPGGPSRPLPTPITNNQ